MESDHDRQEGTVSAARFPAGARRLPERDGEDPVRGGGREPGFNFSTRLINTLSDSLAFFPTPSLILTGWRRSDRLEGKGRQTVHHLIISWLKKADGGWKRKEDTAAGEKRQRQGRRAGG